MNSIANALAIASRAVGPIHRQSGTSYLFYAPWRDSDPTGPTTEVRANSYPQAQRKQRTIKVRVALTALGVRNDVIETAQYRVGYDSTWDGKTIREIIKHYAAKLEGKP